MSVESYCRTKMFSAQFCVLKYFPSFTRIKIFWVCGKNKRAKFCTLNYVGYQSNLQLWPRWYYTKILCNENAIYILSVCYLIDRGSYGPWRIRTGCAAARLVWAAVYPAQPNNFSVYTQTLNESHQDEPDSRIVDATRHRDASRRTGRGARQKKAEPQRPAPTLPSRFAPRAGSPGRWLALRRAHPPARSRLLGAPADDRPLRGEPHAARDLAPDPRR
mmetsp:Transcript_26751/g.61715  ORF Transcript_26751/g.61715 Transcript_26751/m.61715 type:complete len:218 (-) Transcript_26751:2068-2721(-)